MSKKTMFITGLVSVLVLAFAFVGWQLVGSNEAPTSSDTSRCEDSRKDRIDELGGSEKAAMNGISSTLEGCIE